MGPSQLISLIPLIPLQATLSQIPTQHDCHVDKMQCASDAS